MNTSIEPHTSIAAGRSRDLTVSLTFDPTDPLALVEVQVSPDPGPHDHAAYLGVLNAAAARLMLHAHDYAEAMRADHPHPSGGLARRRAPQRAGGHSARRRRQAHCFRPLPWAGKHGRP